MTTYFNWFCTSPAREAGHARIAGLIPRSWVEQAPPGTTPLVRQTAWRWYSGGKPDLGAAADELQQAPASPDWQQHHYDRTKLWVQTYGTDGMYFDQLNVPAQVTSLDPAKNKFGDYGLGSAVSRLIWNRSPPTCGKQTRTTSAAARSQTQ